MARRYRPRKLFKFWLYRDLAEDLRLMEYIDYLYQTRQFATMVRHGLRLMWTLGQGDLSILFELFPTLRAQFAPKNDELLEQFRQMLLQHQPVAPALPAATLLHSTPKPIVFDDEQDTVVIKRDISAEGQGSVNFLKAAFGINGATLPTSVLNEAFEQQPSSEPKPPSKPRPGRVRGDDDDDYVPALEAGAMVMKKMT